MTEIVIPPEMWIVGQPYSVAKVPGLLIKERNLGRTNPDFGQIQLEPALSPLRQTRVLLHEIIHCFCRELGWECRETPMLDEADVEALAGAFAGLLHEWGVTLDFSQVPEGNPL